MPTMEHSTKIEWKELKLYDKIHYQSIDDKRGAEGEITRIEEGFIVVKKTSGYMVRVYPSDLLGPIYLLERESD